MTQTLVTSINRLRLVPRNRHKDEKMAQWVKCSYIRMRTSVQMPCTHINARHRGDCTPGVGGSPAACLAEMLSSDSVRDLVSKIKMGSNRER